MITFTFFNSKCDKQPVGFDVEGHAGFAKTGNDIVCAAVSMLVQNTINCIEAFTGDSFELNSSEEDAYIGFLLNTDAPSVETKTLLRALKKGMVDLAAGNPEYISIFFKEV